MISLRRRRKSSIKGYTAHFSLHQKLPQLPNLRNLRRRSAAKLHKVKPKLPFIGSKSPQLDIILIIGAGISGIAMASHIQRDKLLSQSIKKGRVKIVEKH